MTSPSDDYDGGPDPASYDSTDEDYLQTFTDDQYIDFVANFLRPTGIEICFVFVFLLLMVVGIVGNCFVVYVVSRNRSMWTSMNLYLSNLAVSDLFVLVLCLPPTVINDVTKTFWFSSTSCKASLFLQNTSVYVSVFTLLCISFERWKAICNPLAMPFWRTHRVIVGVWLLAATLSVPEPITLSTYPADYARRNLSTTWGTRCKESWSEDFQQKYQLTQTIGLFIAPLVIISVLCVHMSLVLRRKAMQIGPRQLQDRKRAIRMLVMVVMVFAVTQSPVHLHNIATAFKLELGGEDLSLTVIAVRKFIPRFMSYTSCCLNPILYNFMSEKFRREFIRVFCVFVNSKQLDEEQRSRRKYTLTHSAQHSQAQPGPRVVMQTGCRLSEPSVSRKNSPRYELLGGANGHSARNPKGATDKRISLAEHAGV